MTDEMYIYGKNAVLEALDNSKREFNKIFISNSCHCDEKIEQIKTLAKKNGVVFQFVAKEKLQALVNNTLHQGVVAQLSPVKYADIDFFLDKHSGENDLSLLILDGVEDSHNLGAIIRSAVCAGVSAIILPSRHGVLVNSTVEKVSAGAINKIEIIKVNSLVSVAQKLKEKNFWIIAADHHATDNYYDINYCDMNFALIMGAEHSGISKSLLNLSDFRIKIPMLTNFNSLNVSNATAIILFESVKQKSIESSKQRS